MSHTAKTPPTSNAIADLPDAKDGTVAYDTAAGKPVARINGAWESIAGGGGTPTVVYDDGAAVGNTDQIQGDIPAEWKYFDSSLKGLVIGTSCTSIGSEAFYFCTGLTGSLVIPNSVTDIGNSVFYPCSGLTSVDIPDSITSFGTSVFQGCSSLTNVNCYITKTLFEGSGNTQTLQSSGVTTIHVRSTDSTWTAGAGQSIGGKFGITVIKDL